MAVWKTVQKSAAVLAAGIIAGTLLLTLAYMLPVNLGKREASYQILEQEGWYPRASVAASSLNEHFHSYYPDVLDDSSDSIMLYTAMDVSEGNALERAMNSYSEREGAYRYYWHGYVSILRPLCLFFDYSELRLLNGACQMLLVVLMACAVGREKGTRYVMMLLTSYLLLNPGALSMGLQFSWVFYIAWGGALGLFLKREYFSEKNRYFYFFMAAGICTSYFDLLTYPLFTWGFPLVWWLAADGKAERSAEWVKRAVISGLGWIAGYALMWIAKWGIATLVLGTNVFQPAIEEVFLRSGMPEGGADSLWERLEAVCLNWKHYGYQIYAAVLVIWLVWWFVGSVKRGWCRNGKGYAYFLTGISSVVWYFVLSNHTSGHHFFTYRIFGVSILAFLALISDSIPKLQERKILPEGRAGKRRRLVYFGLLWTGAALPAALCTLAAREELPVTNGGASFRQIRMEQSLETEFVPTFGGMKRLSLGLECGGDGGRFDIKLWEGEMLRYQQTLLAEEGEESHYHSTDVSWKLEPGRPYRMTVEIAGNDSPVSVWVTEGDMPLIEFANLSVDGSMAEGQLLAGIGYYDLACVSKRMLLFLFLTWTGVFMAVFCAFSCREVR